MGKEKTGKVAAPAGANPARPAGRSTMTKARKAKGIQAKKIKRAARATRPPRSVRLAQSRPVDTKLKRDGFGVSVTLQVPRVKVHPRIAKAARKVRLPAEVADRLPAVPVRVRKPALLAALALIIGLSVFGLHVGHHKPAVGTGKAAAAVRTAPDFKPLVPSAAEANSRTFDGERDMVAYETTFSGARLAVSQQPLPLRFSQSPQALQTAADSINAKQKMDTAKGPLYIASNERGDQLAVYAGKQVLLFIHTDRKLDDASWKAFIELLQEKS